MNNHIWTTPQKIKSPQHLQEHTQYLLQDHQKPQTSSKQVQINENNQLKLIQTWHQFKFIHNPNGQGKIPLLPTPPAS